MTKDFQQSPPYIPSDATLDAQIEEIIERRLSSDKLSLTPHERQIFKLGITIGMNETYHHMLRIPSPK